MENINYHCPRCQSRLLNLACEKCQYEAKKVGNTLFFEPDVEITTEGFDSRKLESACNSEHINKHFWFTTRLNFIINKFKKYIRKEERILDIGSGTAHIPIQLKQDGFNIAVSDIHGSGIKLAAEKYNMGAYQFDIYSPPFRGEFDSVSLLDVLEHLEKDEEVIKNCYSLLKEQGKIFITVPAHMWLWNRNDRVQYHKKRYNRKELEVILKRQGFDILYSRYFFVAITPLLLLRSFLEKDDGSEVKEMELQKEFKMNPIINRILYAITTLENKILDFLPNFFGGSLCIIAIKESK